MTVFNAKPHEVRAMLGCDEFCIVRPVSPTFCTVLGNKVSASSPAWTGLMFDHPSLFVTGAKMHVPFKHPEDAARGRGWDEAFYAVRPIFSPGDVVTVKEAFARVITHKGPSESVVFRADSRDSSGAYWHEVAADPTGVKWSRPQNMRPEWSRLTLEVTSVSVKRVQDVTEEEARLACGGGIVLAMTWDQHHPKTPWDANPWVCIARAKVHHCNVKEMKGEAA